MMGRLLLLLMVVPALALAHHSPDHVTGITTLPVPPEGSRPAWWVLGPFVLLAIVGLVRLLRRSRGEG